MLKPPLSLLLALTLAAPALAQDAPVTKADTSADAMTARFAERLRGPLEEVLGAKFEAPVEFAPCSTADLAGLLASENEGFYANLDGAPEGEALREAVHTEAEQLAPMLIGKLRLHDGGVWIAPGFMERMAAEVPSLRERGLGGQAFLDVVLIHEAVHVFQHRRFDLLAFVGKPRTREELVGRFAVIEGHSQHVTARVAAALGLGDAFELLCDVNSEVPPDVEDDALRLMLQAVVANASVAYVEGRSFFAHLAGELGEEAALERAFSQPPRTLRELARPADYLSGAKAAVDVVALAERLNGLIDPEAYRTQTVPLAAAALRAGLSVIDADQAAKALGGFVEGRIVVGQPVQSVVPGAQLVVAAMVGQDDEAAGLLFETEEAVLRAKDEQFSQPGSMIRILSTEYVRDPIEGTPSLLAIKSLEVQGVMTIEVQTLVLRRGSVVLEVLANAIPMEKEALIELGKAALATLD